VPAPEGEDVEIAMEMQRKLFGPMSGSPRKEKVRGPVTPSGAE
jgi:hypothetical protein